VLKFGGAVPLTGRNMVFEKSRFGWVRFDFKLSVVTWSKFAVLLSASAGRIAVVQVGLLYMIMNIFIRSGDIRRLILSRPKSRPILYVLLPKIMDL